MRDFFGTGSLTRFVFPIDGDCLTHEDGEIREGYLTVRVKVAATLGSKIEIDEAEAEFDGTYYVKEVVLRTYRTTITAKNLTDGSQASIVVYDFEKSVGKFRISLDDNILFLADLTKNQDRYASMFENPYLKIFKKAHDLYGASIHINLYYEYMDAEEDRRTFSDKREYFNLSMMTDKYKPEWIDNADWLKLSFHARSNDPVYPYKNTTVAQIEEDVTLVHKEICRFAGKQSLSPVTTLHYGSVNEAGLRVLRNFGYRGMNTIFKIDPDGVPHISCYSKELSDHVRNRDFWIDNVENIVYAKCKLILNQYKLKEIEPLLDEIHSKGKGFMELLIHEQYFHPDYINHIPEYEEIVLTAAKWATEHGYTGALFSDVMFE